MAALVAQSIQSEVLASLQVGPKPLADLLFSLQVPDDTLLSDALEVVHKLKVDGRIRLVEGKYCL